MEIKARELEGRMLLALEGAINGFQVIIGNQVHLKLALMRGLLPPGIYFDKSLTRGKENELRHVIDYGNIIVSQDEESGLLDQSYDKFLRIRSTPETVDMATSIFCWGWHDYEAWKSFYPAATHKIHVTGSPRIDYWRDDFQPYFQKRIASIQKRFAPFVLISSNFANANSYMTIEDRIVQGKRNGTIKNAEDEHAMIEKINDDINMFNHFVQLTNKLAEDHPDLNFVVRPHPAEKKSGWKKSVSKRSNAHVVFEGGISPWVRASKAILHNGCTSGLEACIAKVPAIAFVPFSSPNNREIPNKLSTAKCTKQSEVSNLLSLIRNNDIQFQRNISNKETIIKRRFINLDRSTAAERIIEKLLHINNVPRAPSIQTGFKAKRMGLIMNGWRYMRKLCNAPTKNMNKFPYLKLIELKRIQDSLAASVNNKYAKCKIRHLFGDVFVVEVD